MTEAYITEQSFTADKRKPEQFNVENRRTMRVTDNNNLNYASDSVNFDLATISNSGKFVSLGETEVVFPLEVTVDSPLGTVITDNQFMVCMKSNPALVNSISTTLAGMPVITAQRYNAARVAIHFAETWDKSDWDRGDRHGIFWEGGNDGVHINTGASAHGLLGVSTTSVSNFDPKATDTPSHIIGQRKSRPNLGRKARCEQVRDGADTELDTIKEGTTELAEGKSLLSTQTATKQIFQINVVVKLGELDDFYDKSVLSKNSLWTLEFNLNIASMKMVIAGTTTTGDVTALGADADAKKYVSCATTCSSGFNPLSVGSLAIHDGFHALHNNQVELNISMSIGNTYLKSCVMDVAMYDLSPKYKDLYLAQPIKSFSYMKVISHNFPAIGAGDPLVANLSNGQARARKICIVPYAMNSNNSTAPPDLLSPFCSVGAQALSGFRCTVSNYQVLVNGQPLYQRALTRTHQFYDEYKKYTTNNGVSSSPLNSGISFEDYETSYGVITSDLTKIPENNDNLASSYTVELRNNTLKPCGYLMFLYYDAVISHNVETGELIF